MDVLPPKIDPSTTALVVVDMQQYFCRAGSNFNRCMATMDAEAATYYLDRVEHMVIPNSAALLREFRGQGSLIMFTQFGSERRDGTDMPSWARQMNQISQETTGGPGFPSLSDPSSQIIPELTPQEDELTVRKTTSGPLAGTSIDFTLRQHGVRTAVIVGVATDVCVLGMARELADADFETVVAEDAAATPLGAAAHIAALSSLGLVFARVGPTAGIITAVQSDVIASDVLS